MLKCAWHRSGSSPHRSSQIHVNTNAISMHVLWLTTPRNSYGRCRRWYQLISWHQLWSSRCYGVSIDVQVSVPVLWLLMIGLSLYARPMDGLIVVSHGGVLVKSWLSWGSSSWLCATSHHDHHLWPIRSPANVTILSNYYCYCYTKQ